MKRVIDISIIALNLSLSYSILPQLIFFQYERAYSIIIVLLINTIYLTFRFKGFFSYYNDLLFHLFWLINVTNLIFGSLTGTYGFGIMPYIFTNITFFFILVSVYKSHETTNPDKGLKIIITPYLVLSYISVLGALTAYILAQTGLIDPHNNLINSDYSIFQSNLRDPNINYYFVSIFSVLFDSNIIRLPGINQHGMFTGLYHEPHIFTFMTTPALFLSLNYTKNRLIKLIIISIFLFTFIQSTSATNLISLFVVISFYVFFKINNLIGKIIIISTLAVVGVYYLANSDIINFVIGKIYSGSTRYTVDMIKFAFSPKSFFGTSFYNLNYLDTYWNNADETMDVGLINFTLNLLFLIILIRRIYLVNKKTEYHKTYFFGLAFLYYFLHSTKITMYSYSLSSTVFFLFLSYIILKPTTAKNTQG